MKLTDKEKQSIRVLNFAATYDGMMDEDDIRFLLKMGIKKFISIKRTNLVAITETAYPIRIKIISA
ncbi:MAG: hypothetical protein QM489_00990 [Candidatus Izemoplasma sp.]